MPPCARVKSAGSPPALACRWRCVVVVYRDLRRFHGAPPPLPQHLVQGPPAPIHAEAKAAFLQPLGNSHPRERGPLLGRADRWLALPARRRQGLPTTLPIPGDRDRPGPHRPAAPVPHRHEVDHARRPPDIRDSRPPDLMHTSHRDAPPARGVKHLARRRWAPPRRGVDRVPPPLPPQATHPWVMHRPAGAPPQAVIRRSPSTGGRSLARRVTAGAGEAQR